MPFKPSAAFDAQRYYNNNKEESLKIISSKLGIDEQEIKNGINGVTMPSVKTT
jgi:hypothetical protein